MRAEYENEADLLVIELESVGEPSQGRMSSAGPIIEYVGERAVAVEVVSASTGLHRKLSAVAEELGLDLDSLSRIAATAVDNPDALVTLELEVVAGAHLH